MTDLVVILFWSGGPKVPLVSASSSFFMFGRDSQNGLSSVNRGPVRNHSRLIGAELRAGSLRERSRYPATSAHDPRPWRDLRSTGVSGQAHGINDQFVSILAKPVIALVEKHLVHRSGIHGPRREAKHVFQIVFGGG
jgi:hypothetical protein